MIWFVTYFFIFEETTMESVESFKFNPTDADIEDVGQQLAAEFNAIDFIPCRGKRKWNGEWVDYE